ncbi:MAG: fibronectin type III domain-containing protein, partial [Proteobacteria bacterium]|nr:fibronectin type III domain-containing protein [Pseudomonadota bacterium]
MIGISKKIVIGIAFLALIMGANSFGATLASFDFNNVLPGETQAGFLGIGAATTGSETTNGVTLAWSGTGGIGYTDRGEVNGLVGYEMADLMRDTFFGLADATITVTLSGLTASTTYDLTIYSFDATKIETCEWYKDSSVASNLLQSVSYNQNDPTTGFFTVAATTDGSGEITLVCDGSRVRFNGLTVAEQTPAAPSDVLALGNLRSIDLSWTAPTMMPLSYNIERSLTSGSGFAALTNVTGTSYTDTGLIGGTNYYYLVSSVYADSTNTAAEVSETALAKYAPFAKFDVDAGSPTQAGFVGINGLSATSGTDGDVTLTWSGTPFYSDRGDANALSGDAMADLMRDFVFAIGTTLTVELEGLAANTTYDLTIYSFDANQSSTCEWYKDSTGGTLLKAVSYNHTDPTTGFFTVAVTSDGSGDITLVCTGSKPRFNGLTVTEQTPEAPSDVLAFGSLESVDLSWTAPTKTPLSYNIERSLTSGSGFTALTNVTGTSYTETGLIGGTNYYYLVSSVYA